jgi:hypothetical protein
MTPKLRMKFHVPVAVAVSDSCRSAYTAGKSVGSIIPALAATIIWKVIHFAGEEVASMSEKRPNPKIISAVPRR